MKRLRLALLLTAAATLAIAAPAAAQMDHSKMPGMKMPAPAKKPAARKPAAKNPAATKPARKKSAAKAAPTKKATARKPTVKKAPAREPAAPPATAMPPGHDMSTMPAQPSPVTTMPPGHDMSTMPGMTMPPAPAPAPAMPPGHDMSTMPGVGMPAKAAGTDLPAGNAPPPPIPTDHAADRVYRPEAMAMGREHLRKFHGGQKLTQLLFNIAEYQVRNGRDAFEWEGEGWYGGDIDRLWVKSEGEGEFGRSLEKAEVQALYSRAIDPYFNLQGGLRYDFKPNPSRVYATVGVEGLAPSFFDVEGALFLSNKGELMARASGYYDQRITQRLILQPRAELDFAAQSSREIGVGAGLSDAKIGLRLRYDIRREFAPYIGVQHSRAFGRARRYLRDEGEDADRWSVVTGIRFWF